MEIIENIENKLLSRKKLIVSFKDANSTLTRNDIKAKIAKQLKVEENLIVIDTVRNHFGKREFEVLVFVYESEKEMEKIIHKHIAKRNNLFQKEETEEVEN